MSTITDSLVYYAYDDDICIYVGVTCNMGHRMWLHRRDSLWWEHHTHITVNGPYTRVHARQVEREALRRLRPIFNTTGVATHDPAHVEKYVFNRTPEQIAKMQAAVDSLVAPAPAPLGGAA